jgi:hypothetical protein
VAALPEARYPKRCGHIGSTPTPYFPASIKVRYCRYSRLHRSELYRRLQRRSGEKREIRKLKMETEKSHLIGNTLNIQKSGRGNRL